MAGEAYNVGDLVAQFRVNIDQGSVAQARAVAQQLSQPITSTARGGAAAPRVTPSGAYYLAEPSSTLAGDAARMHEASFFAQQSRMAAHTSSLEAQIDAATTKMERDIMRSGGRGFAADFEAEIIGRSRAQRNARLAALSSQEGLAAGLRSDFEEGISSRSRAQRHALAAQESALGGLRGEFEEGISSRSRAQRHALAAQESALGGLQNEFEEGISSRSRAQRSAMARQRAVLDDARASWEAQIDAGMEEDQEAGLFKNLRDPHTGQRSGTGKGRGLMGASGIRYLRYTIGGVIAGIVADELNNLVNYQEAFKRSGFSDSAGQARSVLQAHHGMFSSIPIIGGLLESGTNAAASVFDLAPQQTETKLLFAERMGAFSSARLSMGMTSRSQEAQNEQIRRGLAAADKVKDLRTAQRKALADFQTGEAAAMRKAGQESNYNQGEAPRPTYYLPWWMMGNRQTYEDRDYEQSQNYKNWYDSVSAARQKSENEISRRAAGIRDSFEADMVVAARDLRYGYHGQEIANRSAEMWANYRPRGAETFSILGNAVNQLEQYGIPVTDEALSGDPRRSLEALSKMDFKSLQGASPEVLRGLRANLQGSQLNLLQQRRSINDEIMFGTTTEFNPFAQSTERFISRDVEDLAQAMSDNTSALAVLSQVLNIIQHKLPDMK